MKKELEAKNEELEKLRANPSFSTTPPAVGKSPSSTKLTTDKDKLQAGLKQFALNYNMTNFGVQKGGKVGVGGTNPPSNSTATGTTSNNNNENNIATISGSDDELVKKLQEENTSIQQKLSQIESEKVDMEARLKRELEELKKELEESQKKNPVEGEQPLVDIYIYIYIDLLAFISTFS